MSYEGTNLKNVTRGNKFEQKVIRRKKNNRIKQIERKRNWEKGP